MVGDGRESDDFECQMRANEFECQMIREFECQLSMGVKWGSATYGSGCQMNLCVKMGSVLNTPIGVTIFSPT